MNESSSLKESIIQSLIQNETLSQGDILNLFSIYLTDNPNFKYNITYLTDSIPLFKKSIGVFSDKFFFYNEASNRLYELNNSNSIIDIYFDEIFKFSLNKGVKFELITANINNYKFTKTINDSFKVRFQSGKVSYIYEISRIKENGMAELEEKFIDFVKTLSK